MSRKLTTDEFIERAMNIHGDRYIYDTTIYVNAHHKVSVTCRKHGVFELIAQAHLNGNNCYMCYEENRNKRIIPKIKYSKEEFINICGSIHNNKFDYTNINYENLGSTLILICPIHGEFNVQAGVHIKGHDCAKCSNDKQSQRQTIDIDENIRIFNKVHNFKYDYSLLDKSIKYKSYDKIKIICPIHGEFNQQLSVHKGGCGCQKCGNANSGNLLKKYLWNELGSKPGVFYKILFTHKKLKFTFLKIGITSQGIKERYNNYKDYDMIVLEETHGTNLSSAILEDDFMKTTKLQKFIFPNNIKFGGWTECYNIENMNELMLNHPNLDIYQMIKENLYSGISAEIRLKSKL